MASSAPPSPPPPGRGRASDLRPWRQVARAAAGFGLLALEALVWLVEFALELALGLASSGRRRDSSQ